MKHATFSILALAAGVLAIPASAAINQTSAPRLALSCLDLHINSDNSAVLTCKVQNTATSTTPVIRSVQLFLNGNAYPAIGDISSGETLSTNFSFGPNNYNVGVPNGYTFYAQGYADDAIFGNINNLVTGIPLGQATVSNTLQVTTRNQPPTFLHFGNCTYEASPSFSPLNFPAAGGTGTLLVDTEAQAVGAGPAGCLWNPKTHDGQANVVNFGGNGSLPPQFGPGQVNFTVLPNTMVNGSTNARVIATETSNTPANAVDVTGNRAGLPGGYWGSFEFSQDGLACAYGASGFAAPQAGIPIPIRG